MQPPGVLLLLPGCGQPLPPPLQPPSPLLQLLQPPLLLLLLPETGQLRCSLVEEQLQSLLNVHR